MANLRLHSSGVFSNVYRGMLLSPEPKKEIALKKTWPDRLEGTTRNLELMMLMSISREKHKNLVQVLYTFQSIGPDKRVCESMLFDFLPSTLHSMIKTLGPPNINFIDVKLYSWQLFNGLAHLESKRICHRDIKPQNILVDPFSGNLKIGDFGSAKVIKAGLESTSYQVTRFYRPPELLLEARVYGCNVDVWSAGCVLGEMLRGKVLFPGRDSKHQFQLLMETFGIPDENELYAMKAPVKIEGGSCEAKGLQRLLPYATPDCVEFLRKILVYRPKERLRGAQLLQDPFFEDLWVPGKVRKCGHLISEVLSPGDIDALKKPKRRSRRRTRSREQVGKNRRKVSVEGLSSTGKDCSSNGGSRHDSADDISE
ncbi:hypothetical protein L596_010038 [Steinernema carpocapsae]|uniref:Protein kinase domain-containing protein n=3 Tax=Steinernema carpocapsae TaxID=34508 RepID=A0A4V6A6S6_STECR|nr:hypothetical protein L596_010038 [Steinernema carpocapsae]